MEKKDKNKILRIKLLIENIKKSYFSGIGKPELLKYSLSGLYSRRINQEHRLNLFCKKELSDYLSM